MGRRRPIDGREGACLRMQCQKKSVTPDRESEERGPSRYFNQTYLRQTKDRQDTKIADGKMQRDAKI